MRRLAIALVLLGGCAPSASALDFPSVRSVSFQATDVIFTADGALVALVPTTPKSARIIRVAPGATTARSLLTLRDSPIPGDYLTTDYAILETAGTGSGFLLSRFRLRLNGPVNRTGIPPPVYRGNASATYYPAAGEPGSVLRECQGDCASGECSEAMPAAPPSDDSNVLLGPRSPACPAPDDTTVVRNLATGTETTVSVPPYYQHLAGHYASGATLQRPYPDESCCGFPSETKVIDWTTGQTVLTAPVAGHLLLADGSILYSDSSSHAVMRMAPGDAAGAPTGASGDLVAAAAGRVATLDSSAPERPLEVWDGGTLLGVVDASGPVAFDGNRVAFFDEACLTTRLQIWPVGGPPPQLLPRACGVPEVAGRGRLSGRTARVPLRCPPSMPQGCSGVVIMDRPVLGRQWRFVLRPGRRTSAVAARALGAGACRTLSRARTWRLAVVLEGSSTWETRRLVVHHTGACRQAGRSG